MSFQTISEQVRNGVNPLGYSCVPSVEIRVLLDPVVNELAVMVEVLNLNRFVC